MAIPDLDDLLDLLSFLWDPICPVLRFLLRVLIVTAVGPFLLIWPWSFQEGYRATVARRFRRAWYLI